MPAADAETDRPAFPPSPSRSLPSPLPGLPPDILLLVLDALVCPPMLFAPDHAKAMLAGQADVARLSRVCKALQVRPASRTRPHPNNRRSTAG